MSNRRRVRDRDGALFPKHTDFPESRKMTETFEGNMAIYEFFDFLMTKGYVLARRDAESGTYQPMKTQQTVEHEVLMFRGVDKIAYTLESARLRTMYPHLIAKYAPDLADYQAPEAEFDDQVRVKSARKMGEQADGLEFLLSKIRGQ